MKKLLFTTLICTISTFHLYAQDWNLVTHNSKLNMGSNGAAFVSTTLLVNNAMAQGSDSIFLLSPQKGVSFTGQPYFALVGNVLGDTLVKRSGSVYECHFIPVWGFTYPQETYTIRAKSELGDSWPFKTGITATVTQKIDTICWGYPDSIKTITLSDGKTIRLSKRFGLFYCFNQALMGLEGQNIGIQLPKCLDQLNLLTTPKPPMASA